MLLSARCGLTGYRWLYPSPSRKVSISSSLGGSSPKKWLNFLKLVLEPLRKGPLESLLALCEGEGWREGGRRGEGGGGRGGRRRREVGERRRGREGGKEGRREEGEVGRGGVGGRKSDCSSYDKECLFQTNVQWTYRPEYSVTGYA